MSLRTKLFNASLALGLFAVVSGTGLAQQPQDPDKGQSPEINGAQRPFGRGEGRGFRRGHGYGFGRGFMQELNLTDDQKQQVRSIIQQNMESTKAQRQELRQLGEKRSQGTLTAEDETRARTLHEQMRASMKDAHSKIATVFTAEQKTRLEELRKERQANHERFGKRRGGFRGQPDRGSPPAQKPTNPPVEP
jgi:Spy/CpxP family protein refolding chaperone